MNFLKNHMLGYHAAYIVCNEPIEKNINCMLAFKELVTNVTDTEKKALRLKRFPTFKDFSYKPAKKINEEKAKGVVQIANQAEKVYDEMQTFIYWYCELQESYKTSHIKIGRHAYEMEKFKYEENQEALESTIGWERDFRKLPEFYILLVRLAEAMQIDVSKIMLTMTDSQRYLYFTKPPIEQIKKLMDVIQKKCKMFYNYLSRLDSVILSGHPYKQPMITFSRISDTMKYSSLKLILDFLNEKDGENTKYSYEVTNLIFQTLFFKAYVRRDIRLLSDVCYLYTSYTYLLDNSKMNEERSALYIKRDPDKNVLYTIDNFMKFIKEKQDTYENELKILSYAFQYYWEKIMYVEGNTIARGLYNYDYLDYCGRSFTKPNDMDHKIRLLKKKMVSLAADYL